MDNRRSYDRLPSSGQIKIQPKDPKIAPFEGFLENISFGGFGMYGAGRVEPRSELEFELTSPLFGKPLSGMGVVRHIDQKKNYETKIHSMGVEFIEVNKDAIIFILKRLHLNSCAEDRLKQKPSSLDFIPY